ncbi:hypothetical protein Ahia01_000956900 [Argonauta hians]
MKSHEGEKCFKCTRCDYAALSQRHLDNHLLTHSGEKPFECNECDQSFRQKQLLKRHKNLYHTPNYTPPQPKEKTHECSECDKSFAHKGNLMRHLSYHDSEDETTTTAGSGMSKESSGNHNHNSKLSTNPNVTAQQLLQGNLFSDLRDNKLGPGRLPQVVLVHPDGRVEEVTSKLQDSQQSPLSSTTTTTTTSSSSLSSVPASASGSAFGSQHPQEKNIDDILLAMEVTADSMNNGADSASLNSDGIQMLNTPVVPINGIAEMKEASTQAELESDFDSDSESEDDSDPGTPESMVSTDLDIVAREAHVASHVLVASSLQANSDDGTITTTTTDGAATQIFTLSALSSDLNLPEAIKSNATTITVPAELLQARLVNVE